MHLANKSNIVKSFISEKKEISALKLIEFAKFPGLDDSQIIELAQGLAESGETIANENNFTYCDIPSTGGPSSLSTLICPLFLKIMGGKVLKLGVPGRPAGGIDVLSQINGYTINYTPLQIKERISKSGYIHFLADRTFAPLDAILFDLRKKNNALNIPGLVIASLLSKKIAVGVKNIGLDIRLSSFGNFGKTESEAKANASRFNKIADSLGLRSKCFITNGNHPQQPYIGRGESLLALRRMFKNQADDLLKQHLAICYNMATSLFETYNEDISIGSLENAFYENISIQGGDVAHFEELSEGIERDNKYIIKAQMGGILAVNLFKIREAITKIQTRFDNILFPDPCGVILKARHGQYIEKGDIICSFRCIKEFKEIFEIMLYETFSISNISNELEIII